MGAVSVLDIEEQELEPAWLSQKNHSDDEKL